MEGVIRTVRDKLNETVKFHTRIAGEATCLRRQIQWGKPIELKNYRRKAFLSTIFVIMKRKMKPVEKIKVIEKIKTIYYRD